MNAPCATSPLAVDDPRHGTIAGNSAGCDCLPCRLAKSRYRTHRERQQAYGRWQPFVDAEPARAHLRWLSEQHGIGWQTAARLAGLPDATVSGLLYTRGKRQTQPAKRCRQTTLDAILAVRPTLDVLPDNTNVPAVGTLRRLRALVADGHPMRTVGEQLPCHPEYVRRIIRHGVDQVTAGTARAVRDLYDRLACRPAPDGWVNRRARGFAERMGWPPPLAWDETALDDPDGQPWTCDDGPVVDEVAIERRLSGEPVPLTDLERHYAAHVAAGRGMAVSRAALLLGMSVDRARRLTDTPLPGAEETQAA